MFLSKNGEKIKTEDKSPKINYAFNEERILKEMKEYIDITYDAHYSQNKYIEVIYM